MRSHTASTHIALGKQQMLDQVQLYLRTTIASLIITHSKEHMRSLRDGSIMTLMPEWNSLGPEKSLRWENVEDGAASGPSCYSLPRLPQRVWNGPAWEWMQFEMYSNYKAIGENEAEGMGPEILLYVLFFYDSLRRIWVWYEEVIYNYTNFGKITVKNQDILHLRANPLI